MVGNQLLEGKKALVIRRGTVDSVDLYEIKDSELDLLERGTSADIQLNFSIFLLSISFSAICALATTTFPSDTTKTVFIVVAVVGLLLGIYLMLSWWPSRRSVKNLCNIIRLRIAVDEFSPGRSSEPSDAIPDLQADDTPQG